MELQLTDNLKHFFVNLGFYSEEDKSLCKQIIVANKTDKYFYPFTSNLEKFNPLSYFDKEQLNHLKPDAIFLLENRPFILFYDLVVEGNSDERLHIAKHHTWVYDSAPIVIIITNKGVEVLNAFSYNREDGIEGKIWNTEEIEEQFSYFALMSGQGWRKWQYTHYEKLNKKKQSGRFNITLLNNIRILRDRLVDDENSTLFREERAATTFLLRLIFIRYLIDREVDIKEHIQGDSIIEKREFFHKQIIPNSQKLSSLFSYIDDSWMNGDLFKMEINPSKKQLEELSLIFSGKANEINHSQLKLDLYFDIFDFSIIPVETISGIYESVLSKDARKKNAAIYTPPFLVEYVLSETLDKKLKENPLPVILDPAMGSGIFLVQAFRHIIYKNQAFAQIPTSNFVARTEFLKQTVKSCIFGIDIDESAVNVAAFSLYIAILDFLRPVEIAQIQLPNLIADNLFYNDFFNEEDTGKLFDIKSPKWNPNDFNKKLLEKKFDFIIGNPPWKRQTFSQEDKQDKVNYFEKYKHKTRKYQPISGNEIAQGFLYRVLDFVKKETQCALIVTSKAFHNGQADKFKEAFLSKILLHQFMDLSPVRRLIFNTSDTSEQGAIGPAAVVIYQKSENEESAKSNLVKHISVKSNIFLKHFRTLVIDQSADIKQIRQSNLMNHKWMFKVALYGTGLDFMFLKRLERNISIDEYIAIQNKNTKTIWTGDGIIVGDKSNNYPQLIDKHIIKYQTIQPYFQFIDEKTPTLKDAKLERGRDKNIQLFLGGERLLIKNIPKDEELIIPSYCNKDALFEQGILGISSVEQVNFIKLLYAIIQSDLYQYFIFLESSAWGVDNPRLRTTEILAFPLNLDLIKHKVLIREITKHIFDIESHKDEVLRNIVFKEINPIIERLYEVNNQEQDLINYVLEVSRYQFQESKQQKFLRKPNENDLEKYAQVFVDYFGELFDGRDGEYFKVTYYKMDYFVAMRFEIVKEKPTAFITKGNVKSEKQLFTILSQSASLQKQTDDIFIKKVVKGFDYKSFYIIKPNEYKSWHRAIAHLDVEEFDQAILDGDLDKMAKGGANIYG